jgi:hypothetical protein
VYAAPQQAYALAQQSPLAHQWYEELPQQAHAPPQQVYVAPPQQAYAIPNQAHPAYQQPPQQECALPQQVYAPPPQQTNGNSPAYQQVSLRNADGRFPDVKCFVTLTDVSNGIHMVSIPNDTHLELVHAEGSDAESYSLLRILDTASVEWAGEGAAMDMARQRVEEAGRKVWAKRKHIQVVGCYGGA